MPDWMTAPRRNRQWVIRNAPPREEFVELLYYRGALSRVEWLEGELTQARALADRVELERSAAKIARDDRDRVAEKCNRLAKAKDELVQRVARLEGENDGLRVELCNARQIIGQQREALEVLGELS